MNKNEKGFTLIELLVTIALMLSILGIAIVSFVNVSSKKKEEAWQDVKSSIETAAIEYFTANEYLFTGLSNGATGTITVGKLVGEDYLNKVTNPITGKSLSYCSLVRVTKTDNKYDAIFDEGIKVSEENCVSTNNTDPNGNNNPDDSIDPSNYIVITEPGAPSGEIMYFDSDWNEVDTDDWFNSEILGENGPLHVCIKADTNHQGPIKEATMNYTMNDTMNKELLDLEEDTDYYCKNIGETEGVELDNVKFSLINSSKKEWFTIIDSIKKDSTLPIGEISLTSQNTEYHTTSVNASISASDDFSGLISVDYEDINKSYHFDPEDDNDLFSINKLQFNDKRVLAAQNSYNGDGHEISGTVTDVAGNTADISVDDYDVYLLCSTTDEVVAYYYYSNCPDDCDDTSCGCQLRARYKDVDRYFRNDCKDVPTHSNSSKCYKTSSLTYDGKKGDNGWYRSNVDVKKDGKTLCTITNEGKSSKCSYVTKTGKTCYSGAKKIDKTKPEMVINDGPKKGSCKNSKAITTEWTATDNLSGIAVEKDYYGYNDEYDFSFANRLVKRGCKAGKLKCPYIHTWGPKCYSVGNPAKGNCYKLKWYLKDMAGNENKGMSSSCYKW